MPAMVAAEEDRQRSRFVVGIDLGTTNSVLAYVDTSRYSVRQSGRPPVAVLQVEQLVDEGRCAARPKLPSFLYLPGEGELPAGSLRLPWNLDRPFAVGEFARDRGSKTPGRLITSAKSWLCHAGVDRSAAILPWAATEGVARLSPVAASAEYLRHLREAWDHHFRGDGDSARLAAQEIVLTVPASFDEVARELTVQAAAEAGLPKVTLVEEPQAVFYAWLWRTGDRWHEQVRADQLVLVCDVGGGTSDFSLIAVEAKGSSALGFRRIAVGDHLLLGGDNMDLALAAELEKRLVGGKSKLDATQWSALQHACRAAKESLLAEDGPERVPVTLAARGTRLIAGTLRGELEREQVRQALLDGFFPLTALDEAPQVGARGGLQEFGLPYAADPAVSRHLAAFLRDPNPASSDRGAPLFRQPDFVLFNGGVFKPSAIRQRVVDLVSRWFPSAPPPQVLELEADDLDLAVAKGAAYFGLVRRGHGTRIAGGAARSFYVGLEVAKDVTLARGSSEAESSAPPTKPAAAPRLLCLAPQGMEEGDSIALADRQFDLRIREPVVLPFYTSATRPFDKPGDLVPFDEATLHPLPPVRTVLTSGKKTKAEQVRVQVRTVLTEIGTLEIWCETIDDPRRWRLQFDVRQETGSVGPRAQPDAASLSTGSAAVAEEEVLPPARLEAAGKLISAAFVGTENPERLVKLLEQALECSRSAWPVSALRQLWDPLLAAADGRRRSPQHEIRWLNLAGFFLRPGYGYPLDEWKIKQIWKYQAAGIQHHRNGQVVAEWWILWRRLAGGLSAGQQTELSRRLTPNLLDKKADERPMQRILRPGPEEMESWRALASLERLPVAERARFGRALAASLGVSANGAAPYELWSLARLGARVPAYAPANMVIPPEQITPWLEQLLRREVTTPEDILALVALCRRTGDRVRDIDEGMRERVLQFFAERGATEHARLLVAEGGTLESAEQTAFLGDTLPPALRLIDE